MQQETFFVLFFVYHFVDNVCAIRSHCWQTTREIKLEKQASEMEAIQITKYLTNMTLCAESLGNTSIHKKEFFRSSEMRVKMELNSEWQTEDAQHCTRKHRINIHLIFRMHFLSILCHLLIQLLYRVSFDSNSKLFVARLHSTSNNPCIKWTNPEHFLDEHSFVEFCLFN